MKFYRVTKFKSITNLYFYFKKEEDALKFIESKGEIEYFTWATWENDVSHAHWILRESFDPCKEKKSWQQYYRDKKYYLNARIGTKEHDCFSLDECELIE